MKIYVSSKVSWAPMWRALRAQGVNINSSWIDYGPLDTPPELPRICVDEAASADVLVLFCNPGEVLKGCLIEVGAALSNWREVRCVGDCESIPNYWRKHELWTSYPSLEVALNAPIITTSLAPVMDELVTYLEIAHVALNRDEGDLGRHLDLSDEELSRLRVNLTDHLNK